MVQAIRTGVLDLIGAARPSIADPFLPEKIRTGRVDDIRECIGCNICTASDNIVAPLRCTQNPTIGEEARKGWHPEKIGKLQTTEKVLVVGGGPAGLEAARAMAERGAEVIIAEKNTHWGGRVTEEAALPGLASWARVRDWRMTQLQRATNVEMYLDSHLDADEILTYGIANVVLATGARWRTDAVGRSHRQAPETLEGHTLSVDAILKDKTSLDDCRGPLVIFDDDRYYLGSVLAELAVSRGIDTTLVTPAAIVAPWSEHTLEQSKIQTRLIELGVRIIPLHKLATQTPDSLSVACVYSGKETEIPCGTLVPVTSRHPDKGLSNALEARRDEWQDAGIKSVTSIGDCYAPSIIAAAVYSGHSYARSFGAAAADDMDIYR
jgi:dimethylamine/trimethylamine dehydrogenase